MIKKTAILVAASMVLASGISFANGRNWQQATDTQTKFWVRDKNGGKPFGVVFKVTKPDGSSVIRTVPSGKGDDYDHADISFPQGFGIYGPMPTGKYHWEGSVDGKVVASDDFYR